ncbi:MAG: beta-galactosidase [Clostridia bacterium]|nr:beta-galactosidase [Clostridia bacterium]
MANASPFTALNPADLFCDRVTVQDNLYTFPADGSGALACSFPKGTFCGLEIAEEDWIVLEATLRTPACVGFYYTFRTDDGREATLNMGMLPGVRAKITFPVGALSGKVVFLPRTPGRLKSVFSGVPVDWQDITSFRLHNMRNIHPITLEIHSCGVSHGPVEHNIAPTPLVDEMGQKTLTDWPGKTRSVEEMVARMREEIENPPSPLEGSNRSRWGGNLQHKVTAGNGFFTLEKYHGRYVLADPDGYEFFSTGLDCVGIDGDCNLEGIHQLTGPMPERELGYIAGWRREHYFSWHASNMYKSFGDAAYDRWQDLTAARMRKWGFNTVACWSDIPFAQKYNIPYTYIMHGYPRTENYIFRDFPDVLDPAFAADADRWAEQIRAYADSAALLGYFLGNEPTWAFVNDLNVAAMTLDNPASTYSRRGLIAWLQEQYADIGALNAEWGTDFADFAALETGRIPCHTISPAGLALLDRYSEELIREYIRIPSAAIRKYDSNHLNLGIRYAWLSSRTLAAGAEFTDIFSFNCYSMDPTDAIRNFSALVGKPVMIGEFHFGALDKGLDATGIRGVASQAERGAAYRYYMHRAACHPMCLGAHYFTLNDQAYLGRFDGENYQIGIVDVTQRPYTEFEEGIMQTHREIYDVVNGILPPTERKAEEIPAIYF